ncbi:hypothetical protein ABIA65_000160 [Mycolicibacterium sp. 624]
MASGIAMAYKLIDAAQARWRTVDAPHLVALVRGGAIFHNGKLLEHRPTENRLHCFRWPHAAASFVGTDT